MKRVQDFLGMFICIVFFSISVCAFTAFSESAQERDEIHFRDLNWDLDLITASQQLQKNVGGRPRFHYNQTVMIPVAWGIGSSGWVQEAGCDVRMLNLPNTFEVAGHRVDDITLYGIYCVEDGKISREAEKAEFYMAEYSFVVDAISYGLIFEDLKSKLVSIYGNADFAPVGYDILTWYGAKDTVISLYGFGNGLKLIYGRTSAKEYLREYSEASAVSDPTDLSGLDSAMADSNPEETPKEEDAPDIITKEPMENQESHNAETNELAADKTDMRHILEFMDLVNNRMYQLQTCFDLDGIDITYNLAEAEYSGLNGVVSTPYGSFVVDDSGKIASANLYLDTVNGNGQRDMYRVIASISVLEYSAEQSIEIGEKYRNGTSDYDSAIALCTDLVRTSILLPITEQHWDRVYSNRERVLVYQGNYSYYAEYIAKPDQQPKEEYIVVIAEARQ